MIKEGWWRKAQGKNQEFRCSVRDKFGQWYQSIKEFVCAAQFPVLPNLACFPPEFLFSSSIYWFYMAVGNVQKFLESVIASTVTNIITVSLLCGMRYSQHLTSICLFSTLADKCYYYSCSTDDVTETPNQRTSLRSFYKSGNVSNPHNLSLKPVLLTV